MTEAEIRKFSKEVLVQVLFARAMFDGQKTLERLRHYEKRERYRKLSERRDKLLEQKSGECEKIRRIERQMNKLLGAD